LQHSDPRERVGILLARCWLKAFGANKVIKKAARCKSSPWDVVRHQVTDL